jgi:glycosyltransferase involved in cell wall biosynthesis
MRIVNIIQCANLGGMEQSSLRLMRALKARGHQVSLISLNPIGHLGPLLAEAGIPALGLRYDKFRHLSALAQLPFALRNERPDAILMTGHNLAATMALGNVARGRRILCIHFHHRGVMPEWRWRVIYQVTLRRFAHVTFASDYIRHEAEGIEPELRKVAITVRNPVELPTLPRDPVKRAAFRARCGVRADEPLIGNAGHLIQRKRFDVFLHTAAAFVQNRPEARFVVAGDGELRGVLEAQAARLGLADRVTWLGWLRDMESFYSGIDALLFNSDWDAYPTTPIESLSWAVPVVASSAHGGLSEILGEDTGWLFDRHDVQALSGALVQALSVEGYTRAARGRAWLAEVGDPAAIAARIERLLAG